MARRRQGHGSAWHWKQTHCWYYTLPGTKRRVGLFDENGNRIRGLENSQAAERALALAKVANAQQSGDITAAEEWLVASEAVAERHYNMVTESADAPPSTQSSFRLFNKKHEAQNDAANAART